MKEIEKLLNSLIQRGWRPWGKYDKILNVSKYNGWLMRLVQSNNAWMYVHIRSIVSLESWLWQFVCKNKLLSDKVDLQDYLEDSFWFRRCPRDSNWSYRLMRVAFVAEEDLEKFLIDNIKL